jgi:hypothetical protein
MKLLIGFIISTQVFAFNPKDIKANRIPASLGFKEGKVKKVGDQLFLLHNKELYHLTPTDPEKVITLQKKLQ